MTRHATIFVDWDSARRILPHGFVRRSRLVTIAQAVEEVQNWAATVLRSIDKRSIFRVEMRVYHGWRRGKTETDEKRDFDSFLRDHCTHRTVERVSFEPGLGYGDDLLCCSWRGRLNDTLRRRVDGVEVQKMVDTALVADVLHQAKTATHRIILVVSDDDDILPGVYTAEQWGARLIIGRLRASENRHLQTKGLIRPMT